MLPDLPALYRPFIDAAIIVPFIVLMTRLVGLRSFSKMSGYDFAITVAMGSVVASVVIDPATPFPTAAAALAALFAIQVVLSRLRTSSDAVQDTIDNDPLLLMEGPRILDDNLRRAKMTHGDLMGKLREANVLDFSQIRAVVFETTGDVSVLHGEAGGTPLAPQLMEGVRRAP